MSVKYLILSEDQKDDIIVAFLSGQEQDKFCLELNLERFNLMLKKLSDGPWRKQIQDSHDQSLSRLSEINSIIEATLQQLPSPRRIVAAKKRFTNKSEVVKG